jgi:uncharacterized protein YcbX
MLQLAFVLSSFTALPPGYEDRMFCPPTHCIERTLRSDAMVGPKHLFYHCREVAAAVAVDINVEVTTWGPRLHNADARLKKLLAEEYHDQLCERTTRSAEPPRVPHARLSPALAFTALAIVFTALFLWAMMPSDAKDEIEGDSEPTLSIAALTVYPIKGCRGIDVPTWPLWRGGLLLDRFWLVVDSDGMFITQREEPRLAVLVPSVTLGDVETSGFRSATLSLQMRGQDVALTLAPMIIDAAGSVRHHTPGANEMRVTIWGEVHTAIDCGDEAAAWLAHKLDRPGLRLVRASGNRAHDRVVLDGHTGRKVSRKKTTSAWCDSAPFLIANHASLDEVNRRVTRNNAQEPHFTMLNFRPNIVVAALPHHFSGSRDDGVPALVPFEEDHWRSLTVMPLCDDSAEPRKRGSGITFRIDMPCSRCTVPSIDQSLGIADERTYSKAEPTRTLLEFRQGKHLGYRRTWRGAVFFGMHAHVVSGGDTILRVGDGVARTLVSARPRHKWR